jgi:hypothetical protein
MAFFVISLVASLILILLVYFFSTQGGFAATGAALVFTLLMGCLFFPVAVFQGLGTVIVTFVCAMRNITPKITTLSSVVVGVVCYAILGWASVSHYQEIQELRETYPVVSLESRLAYEPKKPSQDKLAIELPEQLENRLEESEYSFRMRNLMLAKLHQNNAADFALAQGFGVARMIRLNPQSMELPEVIPRVLPEAPDYPNDAIPPPEFAGIQNDNELEDQLAGAHYQSREDFLAAERMGHVEEYRQAVGFESHQFRFVPEVGGGQEKSQWQVTRLELVSLLRHADPMVYVSKELPNMQKLAGVSTRSLTSFEAEALPQLHRDEDVVISKDLNQIKMLGSLRAGENCLQCHSVRRGELLGAFSYEISRVKPRPKPEKVTPPQA